MIISRVEDLVAIARATTPENLWRHLLAYPTLRAERDDFEAIVVFRRLHKEETRDAARTAALLCTDYRWRNAAMRLIVHIEATEALTTGELDDLADAFLWDDVYRWTLPRSWLYDGTIHATAGHHDDTVEVERLIPPSLRRWAAGRIARSDPSRSVEVIQRTAELDTRGGDSVITGLLDVCNSWQRDARAAMVDLGCAWSNGNVRLAALRLLADIDPDDAARRAAADPSAKVRGHAAGFQRLRIVLSEPTSPQRSLFA